MKKINNINMIQLLVFIGLLGNTLWIIAYYQIVWKWLNAESFLVSLYIGNQFGEFMLWSYAIDVGMLAYAVFSCIFLWRKSKYFSAYQMADATRALILLVSTFLILLQPVLWLSYQFGPRSW